MKPMKALFCLYIKKTRAAARVFLVCAAALLFPAAVRAEESLPLVSPSVILMERNTGKILYAKYEHARMYPASMTKILTSLIAAEYLDMDEIITVGPEIYGLPADYRTAVHVEGETITVRNLVRALMIRSGNETGRVVALNVIRAREKRQNIPYQDAERLFCELMNEKARELGALNTHFSNPYGFHNANHYTTAYDLALICRAYMENEDLRKVAGERVYTGDSLEGRAVKNAKTREYNWDNHNELLLDGPYFYPYATGIKTGYTDQAGDCLAAAASHKGLDLIAVVFFSPAPGRWQDTIRLFEYGFERFAYETIQEKDAELETVAVANHRLGESGEVRVLAEGEAERLLSRDELNRVKRFIAYDAALLSPGSAPGAAVLRAPVEAGAPVGTVRYVLDGETLYAAALIAADTVLERDFDSDMDYYIRRFQENVFSVTALPYWFGSVGILIGITGVCIAVAGGRKSRDRWRGGRYERIDGYERLKRFR